MDNIIFWILIIILTVIVAMATITFLLFVGVLTIDLFNIVRKIIVNGKDKHRDDT